MKLFNVVALLAALTLGSEAQAANLVHNGGFEAIQGGVYGVPTATALAANGVASLWAPNNNSNSDAAVTDWSVTWGALDTVFAADGLTNSAKYGFYGYYGASQNYGPSYLQYTSGLGVDPNGGNFVGLDGDHYGGVLSQTINGLRAGQMYALTFYQATDHYQGWNNPLSSQLVVSLGNQSHSAPVMTTSSGGTPWTQVNMTFRAGAASQTLAFTNAGLGAPPFALLDGVSLTAVPEPGTWGLMILGMGAVGAVLRRRHHRRKAALAAA